MLTLLFDLDDTLLDTNMESFIPAYFQALSAHLSAYVQPEKILPALMNGTRAMLISEDPGHTLQQIFDRNFYPVLEVERSHIQPALEDFYDNEFPKLGALTGQRLEAIKLVDWAFQKGYRVAVATDPLFPLKATHHRLRFAGLPPETFPFALISSYESFHFTKSHAAYFAEFLGRLGWPEGPVLMVGDSAESDLGPAQELGLATFWINSETPDGADPQSAGRGSIADLKSWLERVDLAQLEPRFNTRLAIMALMTAAPASIAGLMEALPIGFWADRPEPGEWSLIEVLCHLRDTEREVNQPRLQRLLHEEEPFIPARSTDEWAEERGYIRQDGRAAYEGYLAARLETLEILKELGDADWGRKARHSIFGPTTLLELVGFMTTHDRIHIRQIWKLLPQPA